MEGNHWVTFVKQSTHLKGKECSFLMNYSCTHACLCRYPVSQSRGSSSTVCKIMQMQVKGLCVHIRRGGGGWVLGGWLGVGGGEVVMLLGIFTRYFDVNILKVQ